jgi:hypothetical protein
MTRYWLTTHWPHPLDQSIDWDVFLQDKMRDPTREPEPGDRVLFYELLTGKQEVGKAKRPKGRRGIVCIASVAERLQERIGVAVEHYTDGTSGFWRWQAKCTDHDWAGFVPWQDVNAILEYSAKFSMLGFGGGSGLLSITADKFNRLVSVFQSTPRE